MRLLVALVVFGAAVAWPRAPGLAQRGRFRASGVPADASCNNANTGCWDKYTRWPIQAIHATLIPTGTRPNVVGKVLIWDRGTITADGGTTVSAKVWDWACTPTEAEPFRCFADVQLDIPGPCSPTIFCAGHSQLDDGRLLVVGGGFLNTAFPCPPSPQYVRGPFHTYAFNPFGPLPPNGPNPWVVTAEMSRDVCVPDPNDPALCAGGRFYGTPVTVKHPDFLEPAHVLAVHGLNNVGERPPPAPPELLPNRTVERYNPGLNTWEVDSRNIPINPLTVQYPWLHVLPRSAPNNPLVFFSGHFDDHPLTPNSRFAHTYQVKPPNTWTLVGDPTAPRQIEHGSGTSVLLPVIDPPADGGRILIAGGWDRQADGGKLVTASAEVFCVGPVHSGCPPPTGVEGWRTLANMPPPPLELDGARQHLESVLLPDGQVVILGGERKGGCEMVNCPADPNTTCIPAYDGLLFNPENLANPWTGIPAPLPGDQRPRDYHSIGVLLPDGSVGMAGGEADQRCFRDPAQPNVPNPSGQIYKPGYFFRGARPLITLLSSLVLGYNQGFTVSVTRTVVGPAKVVLLRAGSVTHSFNFDQRLVELRVANPASAVLDVTSPSTAHVAPPGYYLLFVVEQNPQGQGPLPSATGVLVKVG